MKKTLIDLDDEPAALNAFIIVVFGCLCFDELASVVIVLANFFAFDLVVCAVLRYLCFPSDDLVYLSFVH